MKIPKAIEAVIESFERLPGIGPKSAQRLTFYLLRLPQFELDRFAEAVSNLKKKTLLCETCFAVADTNPCIICADLKRDRNLICVVEESLDVMALERNGRYQGLYHVLHGRIDPLNNIGPDEIYISPFLQRVSGIIARNKNLEIILATNPTMEGEATAMYLAKKLKEINQDLKITRIGRGLPVGSDLEYADSTTLDRAMEGRSSY